MARLDSCYNIADLRKAARRRLPGPMYHYLAGGSDDEWSLRRNTAAFDDYQLLPNYLRDISSIDLSTRVLGQALSLPFFIAPTGASRLFHHQKELAVCRAAARAGTLYSLSTMATTSLEDVAETCSGPKMFQIYIFRDRGLTSEFVERCKHAGYDALCLTVDTTIAGNRERDHYNGMSLPPRLTAGNVLSYASSFHWLFNLLRNPGFDLANVSHRAASMKGGAMGIIAYVNSQFDRSVTWKDVAWLREQWDGPLAIKGLQSTADVVQARDLGAEAVMVSNHGGRQLEGTPAPVDCIPALRDAVGADIELIVDGGIRRGTHVIKALALGADACSIGRPYLYGLAAGGEAGVDRAIEILRTETERSLGLLGCTSVAQLSREHVLRG